MKAKNQEGNADQTPATKSQNSATTYPPLAADAAERRIHEAEARAEKALKKTAAKRARPKACEGSHLDLYFVSITQCGHVTVHVVHNDNNEFTTFKMNKCGCTTCDAAKATIQQFVDTYNGIVSFEIIPVDGHPDVFIVLVHGQPEKDGHQIYPIDLNRLAPKNPKKPVSWAIWQTVEEIKGKILKSA